MMSKKLPITDHSSFIEKLNRIVAAEECDARDDKQSYLTVTT